MPRRRPGFDKAQGDLGFDNPEFWNFMYDDETAPWLIDEPQPVIADLERQGLIRGRVLEPGCGSGEHTILFTRLGYDAIGTDLSPSAVEYARRTAAEKGVPTARFEVANMLHPEDYPFLTPKFDTVVDVAMFHGFGAYGDNLDVAKQYAAVLHDICNPGALVHVLAHASEGPGLSSGISEQVIKESFATGWEIESLELSRYRARVTELIAREAAKAGLPADGPVELPAWLARLRRV
ncbi:methyltransferase domain-containing protein [Lentzea alba]|uniref:class I SAM-dependent methyltransferase n=1 Tax=Lentzea alba TaxID=2714351 RepID=UPI0039BF17B8